MKCKYCNNMLGEGDSFCSNCGKSVEQPSIVSPVEQPSVVPLVGTNTVSHSTTLENNVNSKPKKKIKIGLLLIILLLVGCIGGFLYFKSTSKEVFKTVISKVFNSFTSEMDGTLDKFNVSLDFNTNVSTTNEEYIDIFNIINDISLNGNISIDRKKEISQFKLDSKYDNSVLLKADMYFQDNKFYVLLDSIFDKYISIDVEEYSEKFTETEVVEELNYVLSKLNKALNNSLKKEYFIKEKVGSMTKHTLVINEKTACEILSSILKELKDDGEFISSFSKLIALDEAKIKSNIEDVIEFFDSVVSYSEEKFEISIYTKGILNKFQKFEIVMDFEDVKQSIEIDKVDEENYTFKYTDSGEKVLEGKLKLVKEKNKTDMSISVSVEDTTFGFDLNYSVDYDTEINKVNVDNSVDYEHLTDEYFETILNGLMANDGFKKYIEYVQSLLPKEEEPELDSGSSLDGNYTLTYNDGVTKVIISTPFGFTYTYNGDSYVSFDNDDNDLVLYRLSYYSSADEYLNSLSNLPEYYRYQNVSLSDKMSTNINGRDYYYRNFTYDYVSEYYSKKYYKRYLCTQISQDVYLVIEISGNADNIDSLTNTLIPIL